MPAASASSRSETSAAAVRAMIGSACGFAGLAQPGARLVAAHHRHLHVHEHQVERLGPRVRPSCTASIAARPSRACGDVDAPLLEHRHGDHHVDRVVLDHQHARAAQALVLAAPRLVRRIAGQHRRRQRQLGPEGAALAPARLSHADVAAHQPGELAADRQAQAGAAEARAWSTRRPARTAGTGAAASCASTPRAGVGARRSADAARRAVAAHDADAARAR